MLWKQKKKSYQLQSIPFQNPEIEEDIKFNEEELDVPKTTRLFKVEKILKGSLDLIPSPSPSIKIQIMGRRVRLRCKIKTLIGKFVDITQQCFVLFPQVNFPANNLNFH